MHVLTIIQLNTREKNSTDSFGSFHRAHLFGETLHLFEHVSNMYLRPINIFVVVILKSLYDNPNI